MKNILLFLLCFLFIQRAATGILRLTQIDLWWKTGDSTSYNMGFLTGTVWMVLASIVVCAVLIRKFKPRIIS